MSTIAKLLLGLAYILCGCAGTSAPATAEPGGESEAPQSALSAEPDTTNLSSLPGSRLRFSLPRDFRRVPHTPGFQNRAGDIKVIVLEGPRKGEEMMRGALKRAVEMAGPGVEPRAIEIDGHAGFAVEGATMKARFLRVGEGFASLIVGFGRVEAAPLADGILASIRVDATAVFDPLATMGITVEVPPELVIEPAMTMPIMFYEKGYKPPIPETIATFTIIHIPSPSRIPDEAVEGLVADQYEENIGMETARVTVDELTGVEATGRTKKRVGNGPIADVTYYSMVVRDGQNVFKLYGTVETKRAKVMIPKMRALAHSMKRSQ